MKELKQCRLIVVKGTSKKQKEYYALYLLTDNDNKIFLTFVPKYIFDNLD